MRTVLVVGIIVLLLSGIAFSDNRLVLSVKPGITWAKKAFVGAEIEWELNGLGLGFQAARYEQTMAAGFLARLYTEPWLFGEFCRGFFQGSAGIEYVVDTGLPLAYGAAGGGFELHLSPRLQVALEGIFHLTTIIPRFTLALLLRLIF